MISIDGAAGEGGGQVLRSALALSAITGRAFEIKNIRKNRNRPGLQRQHLTAVLAAGKICNARIEGAVLDSLNLSFDPGPVAPGKYDFDIGSAGSCALVLQTILPALIFSKGFSEITLRGGTHNPMAPPFDFLQRVFCPVLRKMGVKVNLELERYGFYPRGGGVMRARIGPCESLKPLSLLKRGRFVRRSAKAIVAGLPRTIAEREIEQVCAKLVWQRKETEILELPSSMGPGNAVLIELESSEITEVFSSIGERDVKAEAVGRKAAMEARRYLDSDAPVGPYLADQLLLPMAVAGGGEFRTSEITEHTRTHLRIIQMFLPIQEEIITSSASSVIRLKLK